MDIERQLVTIRVVSEIKPIPNADNIELAVVDGWQCVVKKGDFQVGDNGLYFEIDSFIPLPKEGEESPFNFLRKEAREWNNMFGVRIRTIKLRGQISQGLLLSKNVLPSPLPLKLGMTLDNLAKHFGVVKWERDIQPQEPRKDSWFDPILRFLIPKKYRAVVFGLIYSKLGRKKGIVKSSWPDFLQKTDQERIQNVISSKLGLTDEYEVTGKMDGSSMTVYVKGGIFGLCSRNVKLGIEDGSKFSSIAKKYELGIKLPEALANMGYSNLAIQGELCGPGIQGNYEQLQELDFFVFDIFDIGTKTYLPREQRQLVLKGLAERSIAFNTVPDLGTISLAVFKSIQDYLDFAEGPSYVAKKREGIVFKRMDGKDSFKVVSNSYLLKVGE